MYSDSEFLMEGFLNALLAHKRSIQSSFSCSSGFGLCKSATHISLADFSKFIFSSRILTFPDSTSNHERSEQ